MPKYFETSFREFHSAKCLKIPGNIYIQTHAQSKIEFIMIIINIKSRAQQTPDFDFSI